MMTLTEFLLVRIDEDEMWATEAGRHDTEPLVESGEHWRWECRDDEVVKPDTDREFMECSHGGWSMSLRSVEQYPYRSIPGEGPSIHLATDSELRPVVAGHIARHDPARVLAECEAKRRIVEEHRLITDPARLVKVWRDPTPGVACERCANDPLGDGPLEDIGPCDTLRFLAAVYSDHPDYRDDWRP